MSCRAVEVQGGGIRRRRSDAGGRPCRPFRQVRPIQQYARRRLRLCRTHRRICGFVGGKAPAFRDGDAPGYGGGMTAVCGFAAQRPSESPFSEAGIFSDDLQNTFSRHVLQAFNQHHLGILRNDTGLRHAIAQLRLWKQNLAKPHTASEYENRNLLECSLAVAQAAYSRRQNIGAHFNSDC